MDAVKSRERALLRLYFTAGSAADAAAIMRLAGWLGCTAAAVYRGWARLKAGGQLPPPVRPRGGVFDIDWLLRASRALDALARRRRRRKGGAR